MVLPSASYHSPVSEPTEHHTERRPRWWPLSAALAVLLVTVFVFATTWSGIWGSHPAYAVTLVVAAILAIALVVWALVVGPAPPRSTARVWLSRAGLVLLTLGAAGTLLYLRPLSAADVAIDALRSGEGVEVSITPSTIRLQPTGTAKDSGLVFYPGAKVDPRAYARILRPVAEAGYPVVILKLPYNLAVLAPSAADAVVGEDDGVDRWVVGGHSLGGAMAATYAAKHSDEVAGLLLYGAYPAQSMADRQGLDVVSVFGTNDGLATPDDIDASKVDLPANTLYVPIVGGIHAFFGDYGSQSGDGTATISREDAQSQIIAATLAQMDRVDRTARVGP